ncbi:hypothetical protein EMCRGX_G033830 [Ephydatia muelleri]
MRKPRLHAPEIMAGEKEKVYRGTPSRYHSRHVLHMGGVKGQIQDDEAKEVETEGERQLKELLKKQLDTSTDAIHRDLNRGKRQFLPATTYQPLGGEVEGLRSLSQYQSSEKVHSRVDQLRQKGLSENEIELALLGDGVSSKRGKYSVEPEAYKERMEAIQNKIEERQDLVEKDAVGSGVKQLSRHAMEVENSLFSGCEKGPQMHHLVVLEQRKNNPAGRLFLDKETCSENSEGQVGGYPDGPAGERGEEALPEQREEEDPAGNVPLPPQVIERHRLTVEQLKALPRFRDYCPGEPSKVLYVKNIHGRAGEEDLQAVFMSCGAIPKVKLLSGRMRGQAFVEFDSVESASTVMELVNGYLLQDKPLVISYGHRRP